MRSGQRDRTRRTPTGDPVGKLHLVEVITVESCGGRGHGQEACHIGNVISSLRTCRRFRRVVFETQRVGNGFDGNGGVHALL